MATSHKTWEHKTQQALRKPRKKGFLNSNSSPGLEQSLSPARLRELTMRAVLSPLAAWGWTSPPRVRGRGLLTLARLGGRDCYSYNSKPSNSMEFYLTVKDRQIIAATSISYQQSCLWDMVFSEPQISQLRERLAMGRGRWWGGHRNSTCRALFAYDLGCV